MPPTATRSRTTAAARPCPFAVSISTLQVNRSTGRPARSAASRVRTTALAPVSTTYCRTIDVGKDLEFAFLPTRDLDGTTDMNRVTREEISNDVVAKLAKATAKEISGDKCHPDAQPEQAGLDSLPNTLLEQRQ
jgi:hypothetical protein